LLLLLIYLLPCAPLSLGIFLVLKVLFLSSSKPGTLVLGVGDW
ncbi:unnamed protein product, partial [Arabidopsis halleri]